VEWRGVEIHPETPPEGRPLSELFRSDDINHMMKHVRTMGTQFGIAFADHTLLSNSRLALQAAEFAREQGKFHEFHSSLFSSYFSQGLDIGSLDVLSQLSTDTGLDGAAMVAAVKSGKYLPHLEAAKEDAARRGVTGVPAFFIGDNKSIVGAQSLDVFRKTLRSR
jgi:predicted DsbA family dithiol-disulfide isomerase